jgi:hypothetical protein
VRGIFADVCSDAHATRVQMDGEDDHVHLLVQYPPKVAVSSLVNSLKGVSSRLLRQQRPDIRQRYWKGVLWSPRVLVSIGRRSDNGAIHVSVAARLPHRAGAKVIVVLAKVAAFLQYGIAFYGRQPGDVDAQGLAAGVHVDGFDSRPM